MKKKLQVPVLLMPLFLFVMLTPLSMRAQTADSTSTGWKKLPPEAVDSARYYQQELGKIWRHAFDSLRKSEQVIFLQKQYNRHIARRNNYTAFMLYFDWVHSDYTGLNSSIAQSGFPALKAYSPRFGFGIGNKRGRILYDFYFVTFGFNNKSENAGRKIKTNVTNFFQIDIGVDLLKSNVVSLYPFAGLSARSSSLTYTAPTQSNPNFTNISNVVITNTSENAYSSRLGYQAGMGFDLFLGGNKDHTYKTILFVKGGTSQPFKRDKYKIEGYTYDPGVKQADWLVTVGFKFAAKK
jgi:hypothetical protein